jgi:hypothetical protein
MKTVEVISLDEAFEKATKSQKAASEKYRLSEKTRAHIGTPGSKAREEKPSSDFLIPGQKKYPVKIGGKYSQKLLMAAFRRAISQNRRDIANKAASIMKREFGKEIGKEKKEE